MNWIFEAYAAVYQMATGMGHSRWGDAAPANKDEQARHDARSVRR
jgi:hypothetical protein